MPVPEDPQDVAAHFWAQLLGVEISDDPVPAGSPVWGMQLVRRLAKAPALGDEEASRVVKSYLNARWTYCYPEIDELHGTPPYPPRTHDHRE